MMAISDSPEATERFAVRLARLLQPGDFLSLHGELGAGKTRFAAGIAKGVGVDPSLPVTSPTYTILNIYQGRIPFYHFDLYRLAGDDDIADLGFQEYFYGNGVCLVEWPERMTAELPSERLDISLAYIGEQVRNIELTATSARYERLLEMFSADGKKEPGE